MRAVAVLRIFVLDWHIEQRISGMVDGNIGFSISDMCVPILSCSIISSPSTRARRGGGWLRPSSADRLLASRESAPIDRHMTARKSGRTSGLHRLAQRPSTLLVYAPPPSRQADHHPKNAAAQEATRLRPASRSQ